MGKSTNMQNMGAQQKNFDAYLTQVETSLNNKVAAIQATYNKEVASFYPAAYTQVKLGMGTKFDFSQSSEHNLDILKPLIDNMANTIVQGLPFDDNGDPDKTATADTKVIAAAAILGADPMVALAVLAITDVLDLLSTKTAATFNQKTAHKHIGPGLMLHIYSYSDYVSDKNWFNGDTMSQSILGYDVIWCPQMEQAEILNGWLNTLLMELKADQANVKIGLATIKAATAQAYADAGDKVAFKADMDTLKNCQTLLAITNKDIQTILKNSKKIPK